MTIDQHKIIKPLLHCFIVITLASCQNKSAAIKESHADKYGWEMVTINVDGKSVSIPLNDDTCYYTERIMDTVYSTRNIGIKRLVEIKFVVSKTQRDSIFMLAEDAIKNHKETTQMVSDYAGQNVKVTL